MKLKRWITILLCVVIVSTFLPMEASADFGPKSSIRITFKNLGDAPCYATLLTLESDLGPYFAWDGTPANAMHNDNSEGGYSHLPYGYDIWKAFVDYDSKDPFHFLQEVYQINETKEISWTYFPPSVFKILLYFPGTGEYAVSGIYERYAFDSYYTVNMEGVTLSVAYDDVASDHGIVAKKNYKFGIELLSLIARILITVAIEMWVARLFGYTERDQRKLLVIMNGGTQIVLNIILNIANFRSGFLALAITYFFAELLVVIIETVILLCCMNRVSIIPQKRGQMPVYALVSNALSFMIGIFLAALLPNIF